MGDHVTFTSVAFDTSQCKQSGHGEHQAARNIEDGHIEEDVEL